MRKRARSLAMAAALTAVFSVPVTAFAGPKFEELERAVPAGVTDVEQIHQKLLEALGAEPAAVRALQTECFSAVNTRMITGGLGPSTQACIRDHAEAMSRARVHAAADRAAIEGELGMCRAGAKNCKTARDDLEDRLTDAEDERDRLRGENSTLEARLAAGGDLYGDSEHDPHDASAFGQANCPPGFQARWVASNKLTCSEPVWTFTPGRGALDASGTLLTAPVDLGFPKGRYAPAPIPVPPPLPEVKGTCDGVGGALLCYALPAAAIVIGGVLIADAATDRFNLVTVRK